MTLFMLLPAYRALIWSVLGAYLLLPVNTTFELPGVPPLDKAAISNLSILLCCLCFVREKWLVVLKDPAIMLLAATFITSPFLTALLNPEPLFYADRIIPSMSMYDALAQAGANFITLIPFVVAYGLIDTDARRWQVIAILVTAALAYSVLMLIEVRLSPQLHRMIYGFFPHSFGQQIRGGGFRPVVFLGHGLLVAIFCAMATTAAIAKWRVARGQQRTRAGLTAAYFGILLLLCKSLGAFLLAALLTPVLAFVRARRILVVSAILCVAILFYPAIRVSGIIPMAAISELTNSFSTDRGGSLSVRLNNEDQLLDRSAQKPIFGWGSWGRSRIYSPEDGEDLSITDGAWIIILGSWGWVGYLAMFGLLGIGCLRQLGSRRARKSVTFAMATLSMMLVMNLLDSIPNASIKPLTWLIAGSLGSIGTRRWMNRSTEQRDPDTNAELAARQA